MADVTAEARQRSAGDRAELRGQITRIRWQSDDGGNFAITELTTSDGEQHSVVGTFPGDPRGYLNCEVQVVGRWQHHEKFGPQVQADGIVKVEPRGRDGIARYLREFLAVGPALANKLYTRFRERTPEVMRTDPAAVVATGLLDAERAGYFSRVLQRLVQYQQSALSLSVLFAGKRMPLGIIQACIDKWRHHAPDVVRRDPYLLLTLPGYVVSFARADSLYLELGGDPARLKRQMLFVAHAVANNREGHTWMRAVALGEELSAEMQKRGNASPRIVDAIRLGLRVAMLASRRDAAGQLWIATARADDGERRLASKTLALLTAVQPLGTRATEHLRADFFVGWPSEPVNEEDESGDFDDFEEDEYDVA